ncbi:Retrotransposon protein, Ty3-gypsy subclass [Gossypium australe]|uniref:Retrotransposon protein, Ty3-gypsy subclass n=1 Tax=Gossypium australe TaxID=47621 RepID=A0A5B6WHY4_9ROSI|nr:Retrotransposon protein, Ty3-gypsy subclass [Gossypium australe]
MRLNFSTTFHPQTDGQSERVIQILEDMLCFCVLEFEGNWEKYFPLVEFAVDLIQETEEIIKIGGKVCLKVSPWKRILRFGCKGKVSPHFIRQYEIIERIGQVAYRLALPSELEKIHNVIHVSMLRHYRSDPSHVISPVEIEIQPTSFLVRFSRTKIPKGEVVTTHFWSNRNNGFGTNNLMHDNMIM